MQSLRTRRQQAKIPEPVLVAIDIRDIARLVLIETPRFQGERITEYDGRS